MSTYTVTVILPPPFEGAGRSVHSHAVQAETEEEAHERVREIVAQVFGEDAARDAKLVTYRPGGPTITASLDFAPDAPETP